MIKTCLEIYNELEVLLDDSRKVIDLEEKIGSSLSRFKRNSMIDELEEFMKRLLEHTRYVKKRDQIEDENILVFSHYGNFMQGKKQYDYIITAYRDELQKETIQTYGVRAIPVIDNPKQRLTYLPQYLERYSKLISMLERGELDHILGYPIIQVLHMINGSHGELLEEIGLDPSNRVTHERLLSEVYPRIVYVKLVDSDGNGVNGARAQYYQEGWKELLGETGDDGEGLLTGLIKKETPKLTVRISYMGKTRELYQELALNKYFVFQVSNVYIQFTGFQKEKNVPSPDISILSKYGRALVTHKVDQEGKTEFRLLPGTYTIAIRYRGKVTHSNIHVLETDTNIEISA